MHRYLEMISGDNPQFSSPFHVSHARSVMKIPLKLRANRSVVYQKTNFPLSIQQMQIKVNYVGDITRTCRPTDDQPLNETANAAKKSFYGRVTPKNQFYMVE